MPKRTRTNSIDNGLPPPQEKKTKDNFLSKISSFCYGFIDGAAQLTADFIVSSDNYFSSNSKLPDPHVLDKKKDALPKELKAAVDSNIVDIIPDANDEKDIVFYDVLEDEPDPANKNLSPSVVNSQSHPPIVDGVAQIASNFIICGESYVFSNSKLPDPHALEEKKDALPKELKVAVNANIVNITPVADDKKDIFLFDVLEKEPEPENNNLSPSVVKSQSRAPRVDTVLFLDNKLHILPLLKEYLSLLGQNVKNFRNITEFDYEYLPNQDGSVSSFKLDVLSSGNGCGYNIKEGYWSVIARAIQAGLDNLQTAKIIEIVNHNNQHWTSAVIELEINPDFYQTLKNEILEKYSFKALQGLRTAYVKNLISEQLRFDIAQAMNIPGVNKANVTHFDSKYPGNISTDYFKSYTDSLKDVQRFNPEVEFRVSSGDCRRQQDNTCGDCALYNGFAFGVLGINPGIIENQIDSVLLRSFTFAVADPANHNFYNNQFISQTRNKITSEIEYSRQKQSSRTTIKYNSAIIPVMQDQSREIWVYLAIEAKKWVGEKVSDCFTTFGGAVKKETIKRTAARELDEESLGVFLDLDDALSKLSNHEAIHDIYKEEHHSYDLRHLNKKTQTDIFTISIESAHVQEKQCDKYLSDFAKRVNFQDIAEKKEVKRIARVKLSDLIKFLNFSTSDNDTLMALDSEGQAVELPFVSYAWTSLKEVASKGWGNRTNGLFANQIIGKINIAKDALRSTELEIETLQRDCNSHEAFDPVQKLSAIQSILELQAHQNVQIKNIQNLNLQVKRSEVIDQQQHDNQEQIDETREILREIDLKISKLHADHHQMKYDQDAITLINESLAKYISLRKEHAGKLEILIGKKENIVDDESSQLSALLSEKVIELKKCNDKIIALRENLKNKNTDNEIRLYSQESLARNLGVKKELTEEIRKVMKQMSALRVSPFKEEDKNVIPALTLIQNEDLVSPKKRSSDALNITTAPDKSSEINYQEQLEIITNRITTLRDQISIISMGEQVQRKAELIQEKNNLHAFREALIIKYMPKSNNPIVDQAGKAILKTGEKFFHVIMGGYIENDPTTYVTDQNGNRIPFAAGEKVVKSIIEQGVRRNKIDLTALANTYGNFGLGEFGPGLYCSKDFPAYLSPVADIETRQIRKPYIIVTEVQETLEGVYSKPINRYLREEKYPSNIIIEGYNKLLDSNFIADPTENSEINLRNPSMRIVPIGIYEPQNIHANYYTGTFDPEKSKLTPIKEYCDKHKINMAFEWQPRLIQKITENYYLLRDEGNNQLFFKKPRGTTCDAAIKGEIGASRLGSILIGSNRLIPPAVEMEYNGHRGLAQTYINCTTLQDLHGTADGSVNFGALTKEQRTQLFCHFLVNWIISNQDSLSTNFGVDNVTKDIVSYDKGQAFKMFVGSKVRSPWVIVQEKNGAYAGPESNETGLFYKLNLGKDDLHIENDFLRGLIEHRFDIDWQMPMLVQVIGRISMLERKLIKETMQDYAKIQFSGNEENFYDSILDRARALKEQLTSFHSKVMACEDLPSNANRKAKI